MIGERSIAADKPCDFYHALYSVEASKCRL
jgi:hypothetical protein